MKRTDTAAQIWSDLHGKRQNRINRAELHASFTLPYLFTKEGSDPDDDGASRDWQSVGAQAVNHLVTKLMLTLFAPSRPFLRLDASKEAQLEAQQAGMSPEDLQAALSEAERQAVKRLDQLALRPKLFELLKHTIAIGDVLMVVDEKNSTLRALSMKRFVVKRNIAGKLSVLVIREQVAFDELDEKVQAIPELASRYADGRTNADVNFYIKAVRSGSKFEVTQWVDDTNLGDGYTRTYNEDDLPYHLLPASLPDEANYGQGLVGDCEGDFSALSTLSQAMIEGAVMASEYRWLLAPGSGMKPEDFKQSANGDVIPGMEGDLALVNAAGALGSSLQLQQSIAADYVNRIGRTFLLSSAVTRDAERVTAEEIRLMAQELETGLGGLYSRLAVDLQLPIAKFLLKDLGLKIGPKSFVPTIVTGLDALSRNGDLENLSRFVEKVVQLGTLPPETQRRLKLDTLITDLGTMEGVDARKYVRSDAEVNQIIAQEQAQLARAQVATTAGEAKAEAAAQQGVPAQ